MDKEKLLEIAGICKIALGEEESTTLLREIQGILSHMEQLSTLGSVTTQEEKTPLELREDIVIPSRYEEIRMQFPFSVDNKLKVPRGL